MTSRRATRRNSGLNMILLLKAFWLSEVDRSVEGARQQERKGTPAMYTRC